MPSFSFFPTPGFAAKMDKIQKHDPPGHDRILHVIDRLLDNPADADGWMHGEYQGKLKKYVGRRDYRLIYHWCEQCRKEGKKLEDRCVFCREVGDNSVIFFDIYHKNEANRIKHPRG
ncbi:toxin [Geomonas agri]|uniref:toxin n=1 Tax=Geomonas agri TaxID=2873702 RepID=UPI001CD2B9B9|nr:toxin [Geomonas agri]